MADRHRHVKPASVLPPSPATVGVTSPGAYTRWRATTLGRVTEVLEQRRILELLWSYEEVGHTQDAKKQLLEYVKFEDTDKGRRAQNVRGQRTRGRRIWGVLYEVSRGGFDKLKQIEGPSYRPQAIVVEDAKGSPRIARTFRVRRSRRQKNLWTTAEYVGHIVKGLRDHKVPAEYVQRVIDVATETNCPAGPPADEQARQINLLCRDPKRKAKSRKKRPPK